MYDAPRSGLSCCIVGGGPLCHGRRGPGVDFGLLRAHQRVTVAKGLSYVDTTTGAPAANRS
eukprot:3397474-Pyramimonas_sp.AAC.1